MKSGGKFLASLRISPMCTPSAYRHVDGCRFIPLRPPLKQKREAEIKAATGMDIDLFGMVEMTWKSSDLEV